MSCPCPFNCGSINFWLSLLPYVCIILIPRHKNRSKRRRMQEILLPKYTKSGYLRSHSCLSPCGHTPTTSIPPMEKMQTKPSSAKATRFVTKVVNYKRLCGNRSFLFRKNNGWKSSWSSSNVYYVFLMKWRFSSYLYEGCDKVLISHPNFLFQSTVCIDQVRIFFGLLLEWYKNLKAATRLAIELYNNKIQTLTMPREGNFRFF